MQLILHRALLSTESVNIDAYGKMLAIDTLMLIFMSNRGLIFFFL